MSSSILVIYGPTASGKSLLALRLAEDLDGEIINADSMQLYKGLRILTARPDDKACQQVPHHLYGVLGGEEVSSVGWWYDTVVNKISDIQSRGKKVILVGGTGLYLKALKEGLTVIPDISPSIRQQVRDRAFLPDFFEYVKRIDPCVEGRLKPGDSQRLMRACEVMLETGISLFEWQKNTQKKKEFMLEERILCPDRPLLYERINARLDQMIEENVLDEVRALMNEKIRSDSPLLKAVGYPQFVAYLQGECSLEKALDRAKQLTRHYAKRQMTWLRHQMRS